MRGFFTGRHSSDIVSLRMNQKKGEGKGTTGGKSIRRTVSSDPCENCGLYKNVQSPKMSVTGGGRLNVLGIGEAPGQTEDNQGIQFVGRAGQYLEGSLKKFRITLHEDLFLYNAISCRPSDPSGKNRTPDDKEVRFCRPRVLELIKQLKPKQVWLFGQIPLDSYLMEKTFPSYIISDWRGLAIPDVELGTWVFPMFHPSFIMRRANIDRFAETVFLRDIRNALSKLNFLVPERCDYAKDVKLILSEEEAYYFLTVGLEGIDDIVFDYETTCIDPRTEGAEIIAVSIAFKPGRRIKVVSMPFFQESKRFVDAWKHILKDKSIKKTAHNLKFEEKWSSNILETPVQNWDWDTMIGAHLLQAERKGKGGLEFQSFTNYGLYGWDSAVSSFMDGDKGSKLNRLKEVPINDLLTYCGIDSLMTFMLKEKQFKEGQRNPLSPNWYGKISNLFIEGVKTFGEIEKEGMHIDIPYFDSENKKITRKIERLQTKLFESDEAIQFKKATEREIKLKSNKDLQFLFQSILKMPAVRITNKGQFSVDSAVLKSIKSGFTDALLQYRNLLKIRDTYISQFYRVQIVPGIINPSFNLHIARSGRSSSNDPNFQNIPLRNEYAAEIIRKGIIPRKGHLLLDSDYSAMEVRIMACESKDPVLIRYINNPDSDMHRDQAGKLFFLSEYGGKWVNKDLRFGAKNNFVFASFYGSWFKPCAESLWEYILKYAEMGMKVGPDNIPLMEHMKKNGVETLEQYTEHVEAVSNEFWELFKATKDWGERRVNDYLKNGYVELLTGFRRGGLMEKNKILNTPVQGAAFHCLLWSVIKLKKIEKRDKWDTKLIGQIHDSANFDVHPDELDMVVKRVRKVMCEEIRNEWKWIIVPLDVEFSKSEVDGNWYEMKEIK